MGTPLIRVSSKATKTGDSRATHCQPLSTGAASTNTPEQMERTRAPLACAVRSAPQSASGTGMSAPRQPGGGRVWLVMMHAPRFTFAYFWFSPPAAGEAFART